LRRFIWLVVFALAATACHHSGDDARAADPFAETPTQTSAPPASSATAIASGAAVTPSPTRPAVPPKPRPTKGPATPSCVNGWVTPAADTPQFTDPLGIIRRTSPVNGDFVVVDMRYFVGPESPPSEQGYLQDIKRWYIRLYDRQDLRYQGRFIVEQRLFGRGVAAVAPYDTHGFRSPDWTGFQWNAADPAHRPHEGLPGTWAGVPYDFVKGGEGLTIPGLPSQVKGCLDGT
jgi:hypothetical protein